MSRGHLYWILANPIYVGWLRHKGQIHDGLHPAIVDLETWDRVQRQLKSQTQTRRPPLPDDHSFLAGKLYDDRGNRMGASHASKGGRRWRYYVSRAAPTGRTQEAGSVVRIPASEIENRVARAVGPHLAGRASAIDGCHIDHGVRGGDQAIPQLELTRRLRGDPISPSCVVSPVPQTISRAEPFITELPIKAALVALATSGLSTPSSRACFSVGKDSPGSNASLTKKSLASRRRPSAGTMSPAESSTTSPGTRSCPSTVTSCPSRKTCSLSATETLRCSAASSALCSCKVSSTALVNTIVEMMMKLARSPVSAETAAAASRISTSGLRNRLRNLSDRERETLPQSVRAVAEPAFRDFSGAKAVSVGPELPLEISERDLPELGLRPALLCHRQSPSLHRFDIDRTFGLATLNSYATDSLALAY